MTTTPSADAWASLLSDDSLSDVRYDTEPTNPTENAPPSTGRQLAAEVKYGQPSNERGEEADDSRYRILGDLGHGGMGQVFLAEQSVLARQVAIKTLSTARRSNWQRFREESLITARLEHPFIVPVHDAGDDYLVMKCIEGETLASRLSAAEQINYSLLDEVAEILAKTADAVAFAHHKGIIHRDIKPSNIMLGEHDEVQLVDWGLALDFKSEDGGERIGVGGTPAYCAPEMAHGIGRLLGPATDVFLLGATLYRVLAGQAPYMSDTAMQAIAKARQGAYTPLSDLAPEAPQALVDLQEAAMQVKRENRPTASAFAEALRAWRRQYADQELAKAQERDAQELLRQAEECAPAQRYPLLAQALNQQKAVLSVAPTPERHRTYVHMLSAAVSAALDAEDLGLAGSLLAEAQDLPISTVLHQRHRDACKKERQQKLLRRVFAVLLAVSLAGVIVGSWRIHVLAQNAEAADLAQRHRDGQEILDQAATIAIDSETAEKLRWHFHDQRLALARRALGLMPETPTARHLIDGWVDLLIADVESHQAWEQGLLHSQLLIRLGRDEILARFQRQQTYKEQAAVRASAERRMRLERHLDSLRMPRLDAFMEDAAITVGGWTDPWLDDMIVQAAEDHYPSVRLFSTRIAAHRVSDRVHTALLARLTDPELAVAESAFRTLVEQGQPSSLPHLLDAVYRDNDEPFKRCLATLLPGFEPTSKVVLNTRQQALLALLSEDWPTANKLLHTIPPAERTAQDASLLYECVVRAGFWQPEARNYYQIVDHDYVTMSKLVQTMRRTGALPQARAWVKAAKLPFLTDDPSKPVGDFSRLYVALQVECLLITLSNGPSPQPPPWAKHVFTLLDSGHLFNNCNQLTTLSELSASWDEHHLASELRSTQETLAALCQELISSYQLSGQDRQATLATGFLRYYFAESKPASER